MVHSFASAARGLLLFSLPFGLLAAPGGSQAYTQQTADTAQLHASRGLDLARGGNLKAAEAELHQAVALAPHNSQFLAELGSVLGTEGNLAGAAQCFEKALALDPGDSALRRDLAVTEWRLGQWQPATRNLERLLAAHPHDPVSTLLLGMMDVNRKNYQRGAALLASIPGLAAGRPEAAAALARAYYHTGQISRARAALEDLLAHSPNPQGVFLGGQMAEEAGDWLTAERLYGAIRSTYPNSDRLSYHLAHAEYLGGQYAKSEQRLEQLIASGRRSAEIYDLMARCELKRNRLDPAQAAFEKAIAANPQKDFAYLDLAALLEARNRANTALELLRACVRQSPRSFKCYEAKGKIESSEHYFRDAFESFTEALRLEPDSPEAEFGLATSYAGLGQVQQASAAFEKAIRLDPRQARFYAAYGKMLFNTAPRKNGAHATRTAALLEKAVALNSRDGESRYLLGEFRLRQGKTKAALALLKSAAADDPKNASIHYALWKAYGKLGQKDDAAGEFALYKKLSLAQHLPRARPQSH
jgi:protein O-GlcNAc transferase